MILDLDDAEQSFLVDALNDTADAFGDDDFEALAELVENEANIRRSHVEIISDALESYHDRHAMSFSPADYALYEAVADKLGAALGD